MLQLLRTPPGYMQMGVPEDARDILNTSELDGELLSRFLYGARRTSMLHEYDQTIRFRLMNRKKVFVLEGGATIRWQEIGERVTVHARCGRSRLLHFIHPADSWVFSGIRPL